MSIPANLKNVIILITLFLFYSFKLFSQFSSFSEISSIDYSGPKTYEIGGITISGVKYLDHNVLVHLSGLHIGDTILVPGEEITMAIEKLWKQGLFSDVKISATKIMADKIFLDIYLQERPRLSKFSFSGIKKSEADDLRETIKLVKGNQVTENLLITTTNTIKQYFIDKGFLNTEVNITQKDDSLLINNVILNILINKKNKIKINTITFKGNTSTHTYRTYLQQTNQNFWKRKFKKSPFCDKKFKRAMKETKQKAWYHIFKSSKFIEHNYKEDKQKIIAKYNERGYRDAKIINDTIYTFNDKTINIHITLDEGSKYYFRNISWLGNTKYSSEKLSDILSIKKGDVYDQSILDDKLFIDPSSVSSLYLDDGYLFFSATPVEVLAENDSIDMEMRIYEGKQATINKVIITGNTTTNEHVVRREIRTKPGQLFNRSDIIRSQRELAQLGFFDPEKLNVNPTPDPVQGTVDIEYIVEEKPSSQIELSGGFGSGIIVGTLGLIFNNFSARNILNASAWRPLPSGDGQRLSLRAQSNGAWYQSYNMSFVEPWIGGKKPNSLTVSVYHTVTSNGKKKDDPERASMKISGVAVGIGRRLKWPDDFFTLYNEIGYRNYNLDNYSYRSIFPFSDGTSKCINFTTTFARSSVDQPIFPRKGSLFSLTIELTPPYSAFADSSLMADLKEYKWLEYHKWKFKASWFSTLVGNLVLNTKAQFGFLGYYNEEIGYSPFEGFNLGGSGLMNYDFTGRETIAMRGYDDGSLTPEEGGNIYDKFTVELRYPLSLNPMSTIYVLGFIEAGNAWYEFKGFNPFNIKRAAGVGARIFLPMMGMIGIDWGYGFDGPENDKSQFHFILGQQF